MEMFTFHPELFSLYEDIVRSREITIVHPGRSIYLWSDKQAWVEFCQAQYSFG